MGVLPRQTRGELFGHRFTPQGRTGIEATLNSRRRCRRQIMGA